MTKPRTPPKKSAPKREPLSKEKVLEAAVRVADAEGIDALSMRRVAEELGVEAMSLYNHVANKDAILDGIAERVVAEIEPPSITGDWKAELRKRARSARAALRRHRWAALVIPARVNIGPAMIGYVNATLGCLREAGFTYEQADRAWNAMDSHIYGFTILELNFPLEPGTYKAAAAGFIHLLPADKYPYMRALTQLVIDGEHAGIQDFDFGLEILLDGLERLLPKSKRR